MIRRWLGVVLVAVSILCAAPSHAGSLEVFGRGSWKDILAAHAGLPLVVHFWGLSCAPCRKEMPSWGKLLEAMPEAPLVMINADLVPNAIEDAAVFLEKSGLSRAENWIFEERFPERLRYEIDPRWQGEIPMTLLIGHDGKKTTIEGPVPMSEVRAWLEAQPRASR